MMLLGDNVLACGIGPDTSNMDLAVVDCIWIYFQAKTHRTPDSV